MSVENTRGCATLCTHYEEREALLVRAAPQLGRDRRDKSQAASLLWALSRSHDQAALGAAAP